MNEHGNDTGIQETGRTLTVLRREEPRTSPAKRDLVVDLSGVRELSVTSLALLLTAQRNAQSENRAIWLAGVPGQMWETLHAMGLGRFFRPFPQAGEAAGPA